MGKFTFTKEERLHREKWIKELFDKGSSFHLYPFRILHLRHPEQNCPFNQVLISVSARNFKRAVDRNLLKRRIREAYRLQKASLPDNPRILIAYVYTSKTIEGFGEIKISLFKTLESIAKRISLEEKKN